MPPQRRKIVPPSTTSKARKKVAGSNRKPEAQVSGPADTTDSDIANNPVAPTPEVGAAPEVGAGPEAETVTLDKASSPKDEATPPHAATEPLADASEDTTNATERTNWVPAIVVGVIAAVLVVFAAVAAVKPGTDVDNAAWVDQGQSSEVTRAANDALVALYRYNFETIDADLAAAGELMTPAMREDTNKFLDTVKSNVTSSQTATDVDVMDLGVSRLESDKAELYADLNVSSTRAGVAYGNVVFPIVVNMEKIDGKWLVSATQDK